MSAVPACAATGEAIKPGTTISCVECGKSFTIKNSSAESKKYTEVYNVVQIPSLKFTNYDYEDAQLQLVSYNGGYLCKDCVETKVEEYKAVNKISSGSTNINASIESHYTLVVPESVTMTGDDNIDEKTATIPVTVKGNICEDECVTVATNVTAMQRAGSKDAAATVTAPKTVWNYGDVTASNKEGNTSNYIVKATLSPGDWKGVATFTCTLGNAA